MTEVEALARLKRMVDADSEPVLGSDDLEDCLDLSRVTDANGLAPADAGWTPTYDLNRGAAEAWRRKAGKIAMRFDFETDGQRFARSQAMAHCERMAEQYRRKIISSVPVPGTLARGDD